MNKLFRYVCNPAAGLTLAIVSGASATAVAQDTLSPLPTTVLPTLKQATLVGATSPSQVVHLTVSLPCPNEAAFQSYVNDISNPKSVNYRKFLTPAQVGAQFGASTADLLQVENYLRAEGFQIKLVASSHLQIMADATVSQAARAFHTTFNNYHSNIANDQNRVDFYSIATQPQVAPALAAKIKYVSGLQNYTQAIPRFKRAKKQAGSEFLDPTSTSLVYDTAVLHAAGFNGQGKTVAISSFGGFLLSNGLLYVNRFGLPVPAAGAGSNVTVRTVDGGQGSSTPNVEADLDFQMVLNQAPLANIMIYDCAGSEMDCLVAEANDNLADTLTESYGFGVGAAELEALHIVRLQMSAQGMTYGNATGDDGAGSPSVQEFPAPNIDTEITNVGGTSVTIDANGNRLTETGWSGSEGGWITLATSFNFLPSWQKGTGVPTNINFRLMPDVAMDSDPSTGEYFYFNGSLGPVGGTSEAAPMWAGAMAVVEQFLTSKGYFNGTTASAQRFGRVNDLLYAQNGDPNQFFDVLIGSNGTLPNGTTGVCTPGWDFVTGWGAPDFYGFAHHLVASPPQYLAPTYCQVYPFTPYSGAAQGANLFGSLPTLVAADGVGYTETSVTNVVGQVAANQMQFQLSTNKVNPVMKATLDFAATGPNMTNTFFYLVNVSGSVDLMGSSANTGSSVSYKLPINLAKYVSSAGKVTLITRTVGPTRLFPNSYSITVDQACVFESF